METANPNHSVCGRSFACVADPVRPRTIRGKPWPNRERLLIPIISFVPLVLVAFGWLPLLQVESDFLSFYAGAKLVGTPDLYSFRHANEIQREFNRPEEVRPYIRPPFYAALLWPLGKLHYRRAFVLWQIMNLSAVAGFILLWSPTAWAPLICCWFFPLWISFSGGQDIPLFLVGAAFATQLLRRGRPFCAGLVLALCGAKVHLFLLVPVLILAKRLWSLASGLITGAAGLLAVSFAVAGRDWPGRYYEMVRMNEFLEQSQKKMCSLYGLFYGVPGSLFWLAILTFGVICGVWYVSRRTSLEYSVAVVLCGGLLISFHAYAYDCALLLPLLLALADRLGVGRATLLTIVTGISTLSLPSPSISFIGQSSILLLFCLGVFSAYRCRALEDRNRHERGVRQQAAQAVASR